MYVLLPLNQHTAPSHAVPAVIIGVLLFSPSPKKNIMLKGFSKLSILDLLQGLKTTLMENNENWLIFIKIEH